MVKLINSLALLTFIVMLTFTSTSWLIGRATLYTNPLTALGFDWCDADPCFQRIRPGRTSWEEIAHRIDVVDRSLTNINGKVDDMPVVAYHSPSSPHLHAPSSLTIGWLGTMLKQTTARDFVLLYGEPCAVELWQSRNFRLVFPSMIVIAETRDGHLSPYSAVQVVTINDPRDGDNCGSFVGLNRREWAGFRWVIYYRK